MKMISKKILILFLLLILTITSVSASEDIDSLQTISSNADSQNDNIMISDNTYEINDENYNNYFDSDGKINTNVNDGDTIKLGNLTDKQLIINKSITITKINSNDILTNSMIKLIQGSDNSIITGINIRNNEYTKFITLIELNNANNVTLSNLTLNTTSPTKYTILINSSENVTISHSNFMKSDHNIININATSSSPNLSVIYCEFSHNTLINIISEDLVKIEKNSSDFKAKFSYPFSPLSNYQIIFKINGVEYKRTTDSEGVARIAINLVPGNYTVESIHPLTGTSKNNTITVLPRIIENYDLEKYYKNNSQYIIKVLDDQGNPAKANETVTFNINGVLYNRTTNETGHTKLNINLNPGEYVITSNYKNCKCSNKINVLPIIVENYDLEKYYKNNSQYIIKVLDDQGNPAKANETVTFNINGVLYNRTTNETGHAKLNINLQVGNYIITADYKGYQISNEIKIKPILTADNLTKKYGTTDQFEAKLVDGKGNPLSNKNITFNIHGVFYNRTTDNDGIARLNINLMAGEYIITSMYENDASISNKITITP